MDDDYAQKLTRICDLVDEGKLPPEAVPRLFYMGHKCLHGFAADIYKSKCISCGKEWSVEWNLGKERRKCECGSDDVFDITPEEETKWECRKCQHQWVSKDGTKCPACGAIEK